MYDRRQCARCKYSIHFNGVICCDYLNMEQERRGCYGSGTCEKLKLRKVPYSKKFLRGLLNDKNHYYS